VRSVSSNEQQVQDLIDEFLMLADIETDHQ
jgi:hypothetical protein